jgi:hypothetical protein
MTISSYKSVVFFLLTIFITSCKEDEKIVLINNESPLLRQIIIDRQPAYEYTYNGSGLLIREKGRYILTEYLYNDKYLPSLAVQYVNYDILSQDPAIAAAALNRKDLMTAAASGKGGKTSFLYNGDGKIVEAIYTPVSGAVQNSELFTDQEGRVTKQILYLADKEAGHIEYTYDGNGNLTLEKVFGINSYGDQELITVTGFEYDDKVNPYKSAGRVSLPGPGTNSNNVTRETRTIHINNGQGSTRVDVTEYSYKYNDRGYPVSRNGNIEYVY